MNTNSNAKFALRIEQLLAEKNWSQSELARRVGVSAQAVQQWIKATSTPRQKTLAKLATATGLPEHWFFMDEAPSVEELNQDDTVRDERERELLSLFRKLPERQKQPLLLELRSTVEDYENLLNELIRLKNS